MELTVKHAKKLLTLAISLGMLCGGSVALAQAYPSKPIRIVVGFAAGAGTDLIARRVAKDLQDVLGQPVIVDNKPGAAGNLATETVLKAPADGYTLLLANSTFASNVALFPKLGFDPIKDFAPVSLLGSSPMLIAASSASGIDSLKALVAQAKARPNALSYASCGKGGPPHIVGEQFMKMQGIQVAHIPYKGCQPATTDVVANHVPLLFTSFAGAVPFLASGKLKPLAVTLKKRSPLAPEIPTVSELGLGEVSTDLWFGIVVRTGVPAAIVERLNRDIVQVMSRPEVKENLRAQMVEPQTSTVKQFDEYIKSEIQQYTTLIREINIQAD